MSKSMAGGIEKHITQFKKDYNDELLSQKRGV